MEAMTGWKPRTETAATNKAKLRGRSSLNMAISFAKIFLCSPISHNEVFWVGVRPRRRGSSGALPRSRSSAESCKRTWEGKRVFRGKSLADDVMMRRFVVEEEEAMMQRTRRNQMEFARERSVGRRKIGPSPLRKMAMAGQD
ncbi:hypothetical protein HPP92_026198 [Vanilla planifolia]|uniref:Uncharacterized protein n=1 Tax=Vanilla planifolia TaxID=51239 RepID=A0A835PD40_VANPL|nr:hypothetical protein HPP92_026198 [Vanilla planifolia]KAG0488785.1 hypothetical protein HPP92_007596 [Vanilla planifolia]